jgi:tetratricopeptide (TPR) repeat protein
MDTRFEEARSLRDRGRGILEELGMGLGLAGTAQLLGRIERLAGDDAAAEREFRAGYDTSLALGETGFLSTTACDLGRAVYLQGRYDEALQLSEEAERAGAADDILTQCKWRNLRGLALARRGQFEEAERLAREGVELVRRTDYIETIAELTGQLGEVLALAGKAPEARAVFDEALRLNEQKGNLVGVGRIRDRLGQLEAQ